MKRLLMSLLLLVPGLALANDPVTINRSSFTALSTTGTYLPASYLDVVTVGVASTGGTLVIYNSTWTTVAPIVSSISLATVFTHNFNNVAVAGLFYVTGNNTNGLTIIYKK